MQTDADFLGLVADDEPGRFHFTVQNHLARLDGALYGGTAIAVSLTAATLVSERPGLWMTTQFIATAPPKSRIDVQVEVLAPGKRTNQVRVTGTDEDGATLFASLGATGHRREGLDGVFENAPAVDPPEATPAGGNPFARMVRSAGLDIEVPPIPEGVGFNAVIEYREPTVHEHPDPGRGRTCLWVRRRDRQEVTPALAAYVADMVPLAVAEACGVVAGGISLDNTIRLGRFEPTEWVLLDLRPHLADGDYGHGAVHIWNEHGHLMATASQTTSMFHFAPESAPWAGGSILRHRRPGGTRH